MAAVTTAAIGLGLSGYQAYQGMMDKQNAQDDLNNFKRQDLVNPYENMQISTLGADYARENNSMLTSNVVDASRNAGARSIFSALPKLIDYNNKSNRESQILLDKQVQERNYAIAGDEVAQRSMREQRDNASLDGIGQRLEVGRQDMWSGLRGMGASAMYAANNIDWDNEGNKDLQNFDKKTFPSSLEYKPSYMSNLPKGF